MEIAGKGFPWRWLSSFWLWLLSGIRKIMLWIIMGGPIPIHIAIIMDGNRRFAQKQHMAKKSGHEFGAESLMQSLKHCYEFGVKYVTIYAFSIENFKRSPEEVEALMELMRQKLQALLEKESLVNQLGIRVRLLGKLDLLPPILRQTAEKVMARTMTNNRAILNVCVAYTSTEEITQAVAGAGRRFEMGVSVDDIEGHLYTVGCPEPDLLIRTSGETRLSNFLLWQLEGLPLSQAQTYRVSTGENLGSGSRNTAAALWIAMTKGKWMMDGGFMWMAVV
ncbi:hypothetical protein SUGI_0737310 [Cryptomeria japonica]|nr:hypothetical protein SUGI_0737310 [Cryptomeria japonica]